MLKEQSLKLETSRAVSVKHGRLLEYLTVGWSLTEAFVSICAGFVAGSTSLIGFGLDALIESASALILLWRLQTGARGEERERFALKLVGVSFLLLAGYVAFSAVKSFVWRESSETSYAGIAVTALSLIVMPLLARGKRRIANQLNSRAMRADSRQSDLCAYLSAIVLIGLGLNWVFGWWWADSVAAILMTPIIAREGFAALRGEVCDDCH